MERADSEAFGGMIQGTVLLFCGNTEKNLLNHQDIRAGDGVFTSHVRNIDCFESSFKILRG